MLERNLQLPYDQIFFARFHLLGVFQFYIKTRFIYLKFDFYKDNIDCSIAPFNFKTFFYLALLKHASLQLTIFQRHFKNVTYTALLPNLTYY